MPTDSNTYMEVSAMSIYKKIYNNLCENKKNLKEDWLRGEALHKHHIQPKHSGGLDTEENYTYLTPREHQIAHFLLWKINKNPNDLRSMKMLGARLTKKQRKITGEWCRDNKIGFHAYGSEYKAIWGRKSFEKQKQLGDKNSFWWWSTEEGRKKRSSMSGKADPKRFVGTVWMNKNGVSKRAKPEKIEEYLLNGWSIGVGYEKSEKELEGTKKRATIQATCPHCNKTGQKISMYRYHFDNCKYIHIES